MPLFKMAFQNLKSRKEEHLIYIFTLLLFSALLLAAFLLPALLPSLDGENEQFVSNSLPAILLITQFFLTLYVNRFTYKCRTREFAVYALSGIPNSRIIRLYVAEHFLAGICGLVAGIVLGALGCSSLIAITLGSFLPHAVTIAALQTMIGFLIIHALALCVTAASARKKTIKNMLQMQKENENRTVSAKRLRITLLVTAAGYLLLLFQTTNFHPLTASTLVFTVALVLLGSYALLLDGCAQYRQKHGSILYQKYRLFLTGHILSKARPTAWMSAIISGCLLCAMCSFSAGWIFMRSDRVLMGVAEDAAMGFAQFFIAILFTIVVFSIVAVWQAIDLEEHKKNFRLLMQMGADIDTGNSILLKQIVLNFTIPVFMAVVLMLYVSYPLYSVLEDSLSAGSLFLQSLLLYIGTFFTLYISYITLLYLGLKKTKIIFS